MNPDAADDITPGRSRAGHPPHAAPRHASATAAGSPPPEDVFLPAAPPPGYDEDGRPLSGRGRTVRAVIPRAP
ncbi:MAG TPA: hypothetical protein VFH47_05785, partial [Candidatus Thermoplasmatota archaeon]|nr:hypothetical protein [Candidatus Thermoplasmatota archaeon]